MIHEFISKYVKELSIEQIFILLLCCKLESIDSIGIKYQEETISQLSVVFISSNDLRNSTELTVLSNGNISVKISDGLSYGVKFDSFIKNPDDAFDKSINKLK